MMPGCSIIQGRLQSLISNVEGIEQLTATTPTIMTNDLGDTVVELLEAPAGQRFNLSTKPEMNGNIVTTLQSNSPALVKVKLPEPEFLQHLVPTLSQFEQTQGKPISSKQLTSNSAYPIHHFWQRQTAYFAESHNEVLKGIGNRIPPQVEFKMAGDQLTFISTLKESVALLSNCSQEITKCYQGKTPVLFVHGYTLALQGIGGGEDTWKNFPARILDLKSKSDYVVFEFRWATSTRFEEVAADLGRAIEKIAQATGKTAHIIAHSFGGLLIRTYLQGLAIDFPYLGNVASVTTVGTPHSGIPDNDKIMHGVFFNRGQDVQGLLTGQMKINLCQQISCYQGGEYIGFTEGELELFQLNMPDGYLDKSLKMHPILSKQDPRLFDVPDKLGPKDKPGKFVSLLSDLKTFPLPKNLPLQVLIGLTVKQFALPNQTFAKIQEGDELISYSGQRFNPELSFGNTAALLTQDTRFGGRVTEKILGFDKEVRPGEMRALPGNSNYWGYRHTAAGVDATPQAKPMVQVDCKTVEKCDHATFLRVAEWLQEHPSAPYSPKIYSIPSTVKVVDAQTHQPIPFAYVRIYQTYLDKFLGFSQTDKTGQALVEVEFKPNTSYYLDIKARGFEGVTQVNSLKTGKIKPKSVDFGTVKLRPQPERGKLEGVVVSRHSGQTLTNVNYLVHNTHLWWAGRSNNEGNYVITGLRRGSCEVFFFKDGYQMEKLVFTIQPSEKKVTDVQMQLED